MSIIHTSEIEENLTKERKTLYIHNMQTPKEHRVHCRKKTVRVRHSAISLCWWAWWYLFILLVLTHEPISCRHSCTGLCLFLKCIASEDDHIRTLQCV